MGLIQRGTGLYGLSQDMHTIWDSASAATLT